jgi:hypothetical protein
MDSLKRYWGPPFRATKSSPQRVKATVITEPSLPGVPGPYRLMAPSFERGNVST